LAEREGRQLLLKYADRFRFCSHDALIGGTLLGARKTIRNDMILVTSDKGLKAALVEEGLSVYDPLLK
jgi:rRNA-processing protein FCF1